MSLAMAVKVTDIPTSRIIMLAPSQLKANQFSVSIYGEPATEIDDLLPSIRDQGILVPLVVVSEADQNHFEVISGHRRLACARVLGVDKLPCEVRQLPDGVTRQRAVLHYNRQRRKGFSQLMREADALEELWGRSAASRSLGNLRKGRLKSSLQRGIDILDCRVSDDRNNQTPTQGQKHSDDPSSEEKRGRTDTAIAQEIQLGGKDLYRQARSIWRLAQSGDVRAQSGLAQLDAGSKTIHAVYKDLRRRDRFSADFRPTPYDVWRFRHDGAFGIPHPGAIPPGIVAHTLYYFSPSDGLVIDPMAGGGTTVDVCQSMGRRCLAYDLHPARPDIQHHDIRDGFPAAARGCDLIFCDPPYHTMLAKQYERDGIATAPLSKWLLFLQQFARMPMRHFDLVAILASCLQPRRRRIYLLALAILTMPFAVT